MATDDQQILVTGTAATPASWTVPGNGQVTPRTVYAHYDGTSATSPFQPALKVISDGGTTVAVYPCNQTVAAGGSADVSWFPGAEPLETEATSGVGVIVETLLVDSRVEAGITASTVLTSGQSYVITAQGTFSVWNNNLTTGTPNANAMFPTSPPPARASTQVGLDPECKFAVLTGGGAVLGYGPNLLVNLGSGFQIIVPQDGTHSTPAPNYIYTYTVSGQGVAPTFKVSDQAGQYSDNYGYVQVTIQSVSGQPSGGGGSGSLVPPIGSDHSILRAESGVATWEARPDIVESDLSLSNNTTADVTTARHGFAPKAPNDATKYLDGTGAYTVPAGGAGTISDITSTGGTITVGSPTGPTTNVDLPTTGVSAGTYGSSSNVAQITVDARGRLTAASNVAIGGGVVVGADGWVDDTTETWTYASFAAGPPAVGTFTVSGDLRSKYTIGTRIKLTQTTVKYFVVTAAPTFGGGNTTVTISGGTDFTLANAAISANNHSYVVNPQGYPGVFNFDTGATGFTGAVVNHCLFDMKGDLCFLHIYISGTSNATTLAVFLPTTADGATYPCMILGVAMDAGNYVASPGVLSMTTSTNNPSVQRDATGAAWTNSATKRFIADGFFKAVG